MPLKVDVLFVGAHPDDDSMATATLSRYAPSVAVVSATRGEGGGNAVGLEGGAALGVIREAEQRAALRQLDITQVYYLERRDFGFTTSPAAAEKDWGHDGTLERLVRYVRTLRPETMITLQPYYGHGHHQYIARLATEAFLKASDPGVFPEQLQDEGLEPWQPRKLLFAAEDGKGEVVVQADDTTLAREREALREYRSQGWDTQPPTQPDKETFVTGFDLDAQLDVSEPGPIHRDVPSIENPDSEFSDWAQKVGLQRLVPKVVPRFVVGLGETVDIPVNLRKRTEVMPFRGSHLGLQPISPHGLDAELAVVPSAHLPFEDTIDHTRVWEGTVDGANDLTARFGMALKGEMLEFWCQVSDDVVVSNLSAADNRGHWRTDAIELAFGRMGSTGDTVKIGIVPFNLDGRAMAARDADSNPGPISRTLPNLRVTSNRTPDGYRVEASVPWRDLGLQPCRPFGFNLMVYDADKRDAAPGENANQGRTAWSAWPAVQGTPKLWGHVR